VRVPTASLGPGRAASGLFAAAASIALAAAGACERAKVPERKFYDTQIQPIFNSFCVGNTSPCHRIDEKTGIALGNLDLSTFEGVHRRPDVLRTYGPYPESLLMLKSIPEESTSIPYNGKLFTSEIRHAGGKPLLVSSDAFFELKNWLKNGATRDGVPPPEENRRGEGGCNPTVLPETMAPAVDRTSETYRRFTADVLPVLKTSCGFSTCHGSPQSDFYLTCGDNDQQRDFNYLRVSSFIANAPARGDNGRIKNSLCSTAAGGISHTGGIFFESQEDATWKMLRAWAALVQQKPPEPVSRSMGEAFFGAHVMPTLIRRGCAAEGCHSPNGFNDFRLRPGALGFMSPYAVRRNYETTLHEFMAIDSPDVRMSRMVRKNIFASNSGIVHRGGPLLESPDENITAPCPLPFDAATATAFCVLREWHRLERLDRAGDVSALAPNDTVPLAFVSRPPNPDSLLEFDTFRGGADLKLADARVGVGGRIEAIENLRSGLAACADLAGRTDADVRAPEWSFDGNRVVFAARVGDAGGLDLWMLNIPANTCTRLTSDNGRRQGAARVHNFDPVLAPNGALVFASTRAGGLTLKRLLPNADLFRVGPDLDFAKAEAMTVLTSSELSPAFMGNGQLSFTAEKATPDFYQLSGRRINWDLTDYHPLLAQRAESVGNDGKMRPSIGYRQATEIREDLDRNFLLILSDLDAKGAGGALGVFNRSVGPFEEGRNDVTFLKSLVLADPAAHARADTQGVYRSPYPMLNGEILASYAGNVRNPANDVPRYDLVAVDQHTRARRVLLAGGEASFVEPALGYRRAQRILFNNVPQLVFGGRAQTGGDGAVMHLPDVPMLATLLDANLRRGRSLETFDRATAMRVYEVVGPTSTTPDAARMMGAEKVYVERRSLGKADLEADRSLKVSLPARKPLVLELLDSSGAAFFTMREEHQMGPGEVISPGVPRKLFNAVCGGCHGSISGLELDVVVSPDALTGASMSASRDKSPKPLN
jgi:hypothetical protein